MEEVDEVELVVQRVAALDLGKATLEACMRVPHPSKPGRRMQEIRGYATTTAALLEMAIWLRQWGIERVVMESTSDYWKGVYYLLEAEGFDCWLVNAREVKNVPGRAKTDRADAVWLAKVAERGMCRPSLVHPPPIRRLRDLTRYRRALVSDRSREMQRVEKLLEDAQIKISSVLSRHPRCVRAGDDGGADRRPARPVVRWPGWPRAPRARRPTGSRRRCAGSSPTITRRSCR